MMIRTTALSMLLGTALAAPAQCSIDLPADTVNLYLGYDPLACATLAPVVNGAQPYTLVWSNGLTGPTIDVCATVTEWVFVALLDDTLCYAIDSVFVNVVDVRCGADLDKVLMCHLPPGNPANMHDICISPNAVPAHLGHGCALGSCGGLGGGQVIDDTQGYTVVVSLAPNPLGSAGTVRVVSLQDQRVQVRALDPMGRVLLVLLDAAMSANEERTIQVDERNFPPDLAALWIEGVGATERRVQPLILAR